MHAIEHDRQFGPTVAIVIQKESNLIHHSLSVNVGQATKG
jgi:hypothetical protein